MNKQNPISKHSRFLLLFTLLFFAACTKNDQPSTVSPDVSSFVSGQLDLTGREFQKINLHQEADQLVGKAKFEFQTPENAGSLVVFQLMNIDHREMPYRLVMTLDHMDPQMSVIDSQVLNILQPAHLQESSHHILNLSVAIDASVCANYCDALYFRVLYYAHSSKDDPATTTQKASDPVVVPPPVTCLDVSAADFVQRNVFNKASIGVVSYVSKKDGCIETATIPLSNLVMDGRDKLCSVPELKFDQDPQFPGILKLKEVGDTWNSNLLWLQSDADSLKIMKESLTAGKKLTVTTDERRCGNSRIANLKTISTMTLFRQEPEIQCVGGKHELLDLVVKLSEDPSALQFSYRYDQPRNLSMDVTINKALISLSQNDRKLILNFYNQRTMSYVSRDWFAVAATNTGFSVKLKDDDTLKKILPFFKDLDLIIAEQSADGKVPCQKLKQFSLAKMLFNADLVKVFKDQSHPDKNPNAIDEDDML